MTLEMGSFLIQVALGNLVIGVIAIHSSNYFPLPFIAHGRRQPLIRFQSGGASIRMHSELSQDVSVLR
jgi:hypothetical protein